MRKILFTVEIYDLKIWLMKEGFNDDNI